MFDTLGKGVARGHIKMTDRGEFVTPDGMPQKETGGDVKRLQAVLKDRYRSYAGDLIVDGAYSERTQEIVREFQRRSHLVPDGVVGPATRRALGLAF